MLLTFNVNGDAVAVDADPSARLIDLLRGQLGLTGTKEGCAQGECGACSVLVDGLALNACLVMAVQLQGRDVLTVEGLSQRGELSALQAAFVEHGAIQCGYCTPGMLMSATALLRVNPCPSDTDIRAALAGNLCRCTGYAAIIDAVVATAARGEGADGVH